MKFIIPLFLLILAGFANLFRPVSSATVLLFWSTECPVAERAAGSLNRLLADCKDKPVAFDAVFSNESETLAGITQTMRVRNHQIASRLDAGGQVALRYGVRRVPTVVVLDERGEVAYIGPIESNSSPPRRYAYDAIQAVLRSEKPEVTSAEATGCLLQLHVPVQSEGSLAPMISYGVHVRPLLESNCLRCHGPSGVAPMRFDSYVNARRWGPMMIEVLRKGKMPPVGGDDSSLRSLESALSMWVSSGRAGGTWTDKPTPVAPILSSTPLPTLVIPPAPNGSTISSRWLAPSVPAGALTVHSVHPRLIRSLDLFRKGPVHEEWVGHWLAGSDGWIAKLDAGDVIRAEWRVVNPLAAKSGMPKISVSPRTQAPPALRYHSLAVTSVAVAQQHMSARFELTFELPKGELRGWRLEAYGEPFGGFAYILKRTNKEVPLLGATFSGANWPAFNYASVSLDEGDKLTIVGYSMLAADLLEAPLRSPKLRLVIGTSL